MPNLLNAAVAYAATHADADGLVRTPLPGLRMMCAFGPSGPMHSVYQPLVCLVLQGAKHMTVGQQVREVVAGESVLVTVDAPVTGRILRASLAAPYVAVAIDLDVGLLRELAAAFDAPAPASVHAGATLFVEEADAAVLDCTARLVHLLDRPAAIQALHAGILREWHYWLLAGRHGPALRALSVPGGYALRIGAAMRMLRERYMSRVGVQELADAAHMSITAFHRHFKSTTSLTPVQFQKRLRLLEARRLMRQQGVPANRAAREVGYASVSHFTHDFSRMFGEPPRRDVRRLGVKDAEDGAPAASGDRAPPSRSRSPRLPAGSG